MKKDFKKVSEEIIEVAKAYEDISPEISRTFEICFVSFLSVVKSCKNPYDVKKVIFETLFNEKMNEPQNMQNMQNTCSQGFNPDADIQGVSLDLLNDLKKNINKVKDEAISIQKG